MHHLSYEQAQATTVSAQDVLAEIKWHADCPAAAQLLFAAFQREHGDKFAYAGSAVLSFLGYTH